MNSVRARLDTPDGGEWVRRAAWSVLAVALLAFVVRGASQPEDPFLAASDRVPIEGFGEIAFSITGLSGEVTEWCAMVAATVEQRAQGLMHQRDLGGYDGMVFRYDEPSTGAFYMRNTIIPLAVAFFDSDGAFINAQGMDPCPDEVVDCPTYPATRPFLNAIEVPRRGLGRLGIGEGARLELLDRPCPT